MPPFCCKEFFKDAISMIRVIGVNSERVQLLPDCVAENPELNIFSADSMTLIVGPNGSGKTSFLREAVKAIFDQDSFSIQTDSDLSKVEVIYLTLSSFGRPAFSSRSRRLHVLYRARASDGLGIDPATRDILLKLGVKPQYYLRLKGGVQEGTKLLFGVLRQAFDEDALIDEELLRMMHEIASLGLPRDSRNQGAKSFSLAEQESLRDKVLDYVGDKINEFLHSNRLGGLAWDGSKNPIWLRALSLCGKGKRESFVATLLTVLQLSKDPRGRKGRSSYASMDRFASLLNELIYFRNGNRIDDMSVDLHPVDRIAYLDSARDGYTSEICEPEIREASSGMAALVMQFVEIRDAVGKIYGSGRRGVSLLLMIDEGDVFLHLEWQQRYISLLNEFIAEIRADLPDLFYSFQVIITSHSPVLMSDFPRDCIHRLYDAGGKEDSRPIRSFGAQLPDIVRYTGGAGTVGDFAFKKIMEWVNIGRSGGIVSPYHQDLIDDPILRELFEREMEIARG